MNDEVERINQALAGHYSVQRVLGHDGFTAYLARDLKHDREVVLWVTRPDPAVGAERLLRETTLTARLNHPHILTLLDSGHAGGFIYYVMPYVRGESLRDRLNRETRLPIKDAIQITREVADALGYAHEQGVIHLDIQPDNILLEPRHGVVVVFGLPRAIHEAAGEKLRGMGITVGTPAYMSPEQVSGDSQLDGRTDVYSLGSVLYEMLAGQPPFAASNAQTLLGKVIAEIPTPIRRLRPDVPADVEAALDRALAKLPGNRFATALQFAEALKLCGMVQLP
jgi:serine/threonine protein kinase